MISTNLFIKYNTRGTDLLCRVFNCSPRELPLEFKDRKTTIKILKGGFIETIIDNLPSFVTCETDNDHYIITGYLSSLVTIINTGVDYEI